MSFAVSSNRQSGYFMHYFGGTVLFSAHGCHSVELRGYNAIVTGGSKGIDGVYVCP
ncbi:MAG: hypothetical protein JSR39_08345 [Verrucomicrobia bacterium]|nr:hypothetical protein [Verrucomicrobiota bacterium]